MSTEETKIEEYYDDKEWNVSGSKTFAKSTSIRDAFSQNQITLKKEYDQNEENEVLQSDIKITNEDLRSFAESLDEGKPLEIGDYKIHCENDLKNYKDNFEIKAVETEDIKSEPSDTIEMDINDDLKENVHSSKEYGRLGMLNRAGKLFKCYSCGFESKYKAKVELHIKNHHQAINHERENKTMPNGYQSSLDSDVSEDDEKRYKCAHCKYQTGHKGTMNRHLRTHNDARPYECEVCARQFKQRRHLEDHTFTHTAERRFHCVHCDYKTNNKTCLKTHFKNEHEFGKNKKYKCSQCLYESNRKSNFTNHLRRHSCKCMQNNNQTYGCSKCEYKTDNDAKLEKRFCCLYCDYKTDRKTSLTRHWKNKHASGEDKDFKCSQCQYETNYKRCLDIHIRKHASNVNFKCSQCDYQTNVEVYFNTHLKYKHGNVEKQKCPKCEYETNKQHRMNEHLLTHNNLRLYKCKMCNKEFKLNHHLITHNLLHSEEKRFCCESCDYKSNYKTLLLKHQSKHAEMESN